MISNYQATVSRNGKSLAKNAVVTEIDGPSKNVTDEELLKFLNPSIKALIAALDI